MADYLAFSGPRAAAIRKPDGRIRLRTGAFVGNNVENTAGAGQRRTCSAPKGKTVTFGVSIQDDGTGIDRCKVKATGAASGRSTVKDFHYTVKDFHGSTDITAKAVGGTFTTALLIPGATELIAAKATVKSGLAVGSRATRLGNPYVGRQQHPEGRCQVHRQAEVERRQERQR